jgi:FG-GAP-like repeat
VKRLVAVIGVLVVAGTAGAAGTSGGSPSFKAARDFDTSAKAPQGVAVADLNGDGKLDLVTVHGSDDGDLRGLRLVSVLMGRGDGRFKQSHAYPTGRPGDELGAWSIAVGDVTGDGKLDIATGNPGAKSVSVLVNSGRGAFEPPANYPLNREPWDIAIADLNADGKLDIATANPNTVSVLLNRGDGTLGDKVDYPAGRDTWGFAVGDLNGDRKPDIVTANNNRSSVSVLVNRGDGSFGANVDYPTGPGAKAIAMGDVNLDGKPDVVTANGSTSPGGDDDWADSVSVLIGRGDGTLRAKRDYRHDGGQMQDRLEFVSIRIGDINGDRKPDLITADAGDDYTFSVFRNGGNGTFRSHFDYGWIDFTSESVGLGSEAVALGDVNADRKLDVVVPRWLSVSVFINAPGLCTVPNVESLQLSAARRRLARWHCRVGQIRWRAGGTRGYVLSQRPWLGAVLSKGGKVNLVVSAGRRS